MYFHLLCATVNGNYQNVSLLTLSTKYSSFTDTIKGCNDTHKQLHNFTRVYKDNNNEAFWFTVSSIFYKFLITYHFL